MKKGTLPAIVIGGPPHSGKSVFSALLNQQLRAQPLHFYRLDTTPDGEGLWSQAVTDPMRRQLRQKGSYTAAHVAAMVERLQKRPVPLLVDLGGKRSPENQRLMREATHAIVLSSSPDELEAWQRFCEAEGLTLLALLDSQLHGEERCHSAPGASPLRGVVSGLERGQQVAGPVVRAVAALIAPLFKEAPTLPLAAPVPPLDLVEVAWRLAIDPNQWQLSDLHRVLAIAGAGQPLALYGSSPLWLQVALLLAADPVKRWCYNMRTPAWHQIRPLEQQGAAPGLTLSPLPELAGYRLTFTDYNEHLRPEEFPAVPPLPGTGGLILDAPFPNWLAASIATSYPRASWIALNEPRWQQGVVVRGGDGYEVGQLIPYTPTP